MTLYTPVKYDANVAFFNENNYKNEVYSTLKGIRAFLTAEGYVVTQVHDNSIQINKGSVNGCKSFIDYKAPLFKNVEYWIDDSVLNNAKVIIKTLPHIIYSQEN